MGKPWPFVSRQVELDQIARALCDRAASGLILAGQSGVGKTQLALEAISRIDPRRDMAQWVIATEATRPLPLGALAPILPAELPAASDRVNLLHLVAAALVAPATGRRLVLGVDDAHLLDDLSAALLHQMVHTKAAFVLAAVRSDCPAPEPITALWRNSLVDRIDLVQLSLHDVELMLTEHLAGGVDGLTVQRLWRISAGNTLLLRELVSAGRQAGAFRSVAGIWRWPGPWVLGPRVVELIEQRLNRLDRPDREVLELLAYADPIDLDVLCRIVPPTAVERVEERGLCRAEQHGERVLVSLGHPMYGEVLRERTPVLRARRWQRQLADALEQDGSRQLHNWLRIATWRLNSGTDVPTEILIKAARQAWTLFDLGLAERLARAALNLGAKLAAGEILWRVLMLQEHLDEADELLAGLEDAATTDREAARLAIGRAYLHWGSDPAESHLGLIEAALGHVTDPLAQGDLRALQAVMHAHACRFQPAAMLAGELLEDQAARGPVLAHAHVAMGMAQLLRGQLEPAIASFDQAVTSNGWQTDTPWLGEVARVWRCQAQLLEGQLDKGAGDAERDYERGISSGYAMAILLACISRGKICRARGQLRQSLRWLQEALGINGEERWFRLQILSQLAHTYALLGNHTVAEPSFAEAIAARRPSFLVYHLWLDLAAPWVAAAGGDLTTAIHQGLRTASQLRETAPGYEAVALHDVVRFGGAAKATERLEQLAGARPDALIGVYAAHAGALMRHDADALERVCAELETGGLLLLAAEAAAEASSAHQRAGRDTDARRTAARAGLLADLCEGAATPSLRTLRTPQLTPRQREIASLAAAGHTADEIANRLVVSVRTVENHLHQAYTKLSIHSRADLTSVLRRPE